MAAEFLAAGPLSIADIDDLLEQAIAALEGEKSLLDLAGGQVETDSQLLDSVLRQQKQEERQAMAMAERARMQFRAEPHPRLRNRI